MVDRPQMIFVHGLFSSASVWDQFKAVLAEDHTFPELDHYCFEYPSPKARFSLKRRIPSFDDLADRFRTFIRLSCQSTGPIVLVTHSQGGLIVQRFLARSLESEQFGEIRRIKAIILFSCPNSGSDILISLRRGIVVWRHTQESELRPLNRLVTETRRTIIRKVINADPNVPDSCHIPMYFYAGEEDNIVTSVSALDVFPAENTGVVTGDHSSIIQPTSAEHEAFKALKQHVQQMVEQNTIAVTNEDIEPPPELPDGRIIDIAELLTNALSYANQGQNSQAEATFRQASATGDLDALQAYSRFQRQQGRLDRSIATSRRVIDQLAAAEDNVENRVLRSKVLATIGISERYLGKLRRSEKSLREAALAPHGDSADELDARAYALDNLGLTFMRSADMKAARESFYDSRRIREKQGDLIKLSLSFLNIARIDFREGDLASASESCTSALALLDPETQAADVAAALSLQGEIALAQEDIASAEAAFGEALRLNNLSGRNVSVALSQQQLGRALLSKGDTAEAEVLARRSLENSESAANAEGKVGAKQLLARIAVAAGNTTTAVAMLEGCISQYRELGNLTGEAWSSYYLAEVLYQLDRTEAADARLQRAAALNEWTTNAALRRALEHFNPH